jgi:16S rRNA (cytosine1402-N4)-methyltransferase
MTSNILQDTSHTHIPVMVNEVLNLLITDQQGIYLDGTLGLGGHATYILNALSYSARLLGLDRDEKALAICKERLSGSGAFSCHHLSYDIFPQLLNQEGITAVNGILLDLGLSSYQLDSHRGFSFRNTGILDMRFDSASGQTAAQLIHQASADDLADIFYKFGEERLSRRIAKSVKDMTSMESIEDLKEAVRRSTPPKNRQKTLARIFQSLRIAVNGELDRLQHFLDSFIEFLTPGGRIVIISYHSLEDRMVKQSFKALKKENLLTVLTKKPLPPTNEEQTKNSRSRSAKLRAGERI